MGEEYIGANYALAKVEADNNTATAKNKIFFIIISF